MPRIITPFASVTKRTQLDRVKRSLFQSLSSFGLHSEGAKMIQNSYNATFKVHDHAGEPFAARIIVESNRTPEECKAEMEWTAYCARGKSFTIAPPKRTNDGEFALSTRIPGLDRDCGVTVSRWMEGKLIEHTSTEQDMIDLARATRELHEIGRDYAPKETQPFREWNDPLDGLPRCFRGDAIFDEVHDRTQSLLDRLDQELPRITIHADLHRENVLRNDQGLVVLDFEMSCLGWPVLDVSTTVYALRFADHAPEIESAYWRGLELSMDDLGVTDVEFNLLLAARQYVLVNDVYQAKVAEFVALRDQYRDVARERMRHMLDTGTFNPKVCKMKL